MESKIDEYVQSGNLEPKTAAYYLRLLRCHWGASFPACYFERDYAKIERNVSRLELGMRKKVASAFLHFCAWLNSAHNYASDARAFDLLGIPVMRLAEVDILRDHVNDEDALRPLTFWRFKLLVFFLCYIEPTPQALLDIKAEHLQLLAAHHDPRVAATFASLAQSSLCPVSGHIFVSPTDPGHILDKTSIHRVVSQASQVLYLRHLQPKAVANTFYLLQHAPKPQGVQSAT